MEVLKATPVDDLYDDDETYQFTVELMELEKIMISVFNTQTGITFKTYIDKDSEWFQSNIYIFHADFSEALSILKNSLLTNDPILPHVEKEIKDTLLITINYEDTMYPFQLHTSIPKYFSGSLLEDRIVSLEYQVNKLKQGTKKKKVKQVSDEIYDAVGNLIYKGEMKDGKRHGQGIEYCPTKKDVVIYEGEFVDGYYEGEGVLYLVSSNLPNMNNTYYTGTFKNGLFHGLIKHMTDDGVIKQSEATYKNGNLEGLSTSYTGGNTTKPSWKQLEIYYKNGKQHGSYKQYDEQGNLIINYTFENGLRK